MYENGTMLNRYAAKRIHRKKRQRQSTPRHYASYQDYVRDKELKYGDWSHVLWLRKSGRRPDWEKWWHAYSGYTNPEWKKLLKKDNHSSARAYYRGCLATIRPDDEDIVIIPVDRFKDPWGDD